MRVRKTKTTSQKQRDNYFNKLTSHIFRELIKRYTQKMTELGRFEEIRFRTLLCQNLDIPYEVFRNIHDQGIGQINYILLTIEKCNALGLDVSEVFSINYFGNLGIQASKDLEEQVFVIDEIILPDV